MRLLAHEEKNGLLDDKYGLMYLHCTRKGAVFLDKAQNKALRLICAAIRTTPTSIQEI